MRLGLPRLRSVFSRILLVVTSTALSTAGLTVLVAATLVQSDKEAAIVEDAVERAERGRGELEARLLLSRAELRSVALASERGLLMEVPRLVSGRVMALEAFRGDEELVVAATDPAARTTLRGLPRIGAPLRQVDATTLFVEVELARTTVRGLVDLSDVLSAAPGWRVRLAEHDETSAPAGAIGGGVNVAGAVVARPTEVAGEPMLGAMAVGPEGLSIEVLAPLVPARRAASRVTTRVLGYSLLTLLPIGLLVWVLTRRVTAPVRALAHAVHRAHDGPVVLPPLPDDEIGELGRAIEGMSRRLRADANARRDAVDFARSVNRLTETDEIRSALREALVKSAPGVVWWVLSPSAVDAPPPGLPLGRASLKELFRREDGDSVRPPPGSRESSAVNLEARSELLVSSLHGTRATQAVVVGKGALDESGQRLVQLLCRVTQSALRASEAARNATENEKLALLGRLAAGVTHEINNPLGFVLTNVQLLEKELHGEHQEIAADARVGVERVARIVRDLSSLAKGGAALELAPTDLAAVAREAQKVARVRHPNVRIVVEAAPSAVVVCDAGRIEQALLNLVVNASDAVHRVTHPRIVLALQLEAGVARLSVKDNGRGIPESALPHIFEPFFTTKKDEGTGLGLFVSRALVRAHGGDIVVEKTGPEGTTMTLTLPASLERLSAPSVEPPAAARSSPVVAARP